MTEREVGKETGWEGREGDGEGGMKSGKEGGRASWRNRREG